MSVSRHGRLRCLPEKRVAKSCIIGKPTATRRVMTLLHKMLIYSSEFTVCSKGSSLFGRWLRQIVWCTVLQARRSRFRFLMVSLASVIDIILPAALWSLGWLSHYQNWVLEIFPVGKGGRCVGLTTLPPSCADCL